MSTRARSAPPEAVLNRFAGRWRTEEVELGFPELLFAIPELDPADVAIEIDGGGRDEDVLANVQVCSVRRIRNHQTRPREAIIADEDRGTRMCGVGNTPTRREWTLRTYGRTGRDGRHECFNAFGYAVRNWLDANLSRSSACRDSHDRGQNRIVFSGSGAAGVFNPNRH